MRNVTEEIARIDIPEGLAPAFSMKLKVPFTGEPLMTWVGYADRSTDSVLILCCFGAMVNPVGREGEIKGQLKQSLRQEGIDTEHHAHKRESYDQPIAIRGKPTSFKFTKGMDENLQLQRIEVEGVFEAHQGLAMLLVSVDAQKYPEQAIQQMLESIR